MLYRVAQTALIAYIVGFFLGAISIMDHGWLHLAAMVTLVVGVALLMFATAMSWIIRQDREDEQC